jgi:putative drug exporter of the RND superfamily
LTRIVGFATARARLVTAVWIVLVSVLALLGRDLDRELTIHSLTIDGTQSARAHELAQREFDSGEDIVVMLRGPGAAVERQGRRLERRLLASPNTLVISPWGGGAALRGLRPKPSIAALVLRVEGNVTDVLAPVRREVEGSIGGPVHATVAGFPAIVESLRDASADASKLGELIAIPVLLLVLLLVFRSVLAAIMPVVVGGAVVAAGRGILSLLHGFVEIDLFAAGLVGMMGLALGVDYSLLVVARFREERGASDHREAVATTVAATARSILPAGCGLILAMAISGLALPGALAQSAAIAVITVAVLSMISAICVVPALLVLAGTNLDRWSLPRRSPSRSGRPRRSRRLAGQPRAVISILVGMGILAGFAFTLDTNVASIDFLPPDNPGRKQQEEVQRALGAGWVGPMEVIMNGHGQPVTSASRLRALAEFQRRVERDPRVKTVAGFAQIERGTSQLNGVEDQLADQERGLDRLETGIARAGRGARLNTSGLRRAAEGSGALDSGIGLAGAGAGALAGGLTKTSAGSGQLVRGLGRVDDGSGELSEGAAKASTGAGKLADGLAKAREQTGEIVGTARLFTNAMRAGEERLDEVQAPLDNTESQLAAAWQALRRMTTGRADPEYTAALRAVEEANRNLTGNDPATGERADPSFAGVGAGIERADGQFGVGGYLAARLGKSGRQARTGVGKLAKASARLDRGLGRLADGSSRLSDGIAALAQGSERLSPAMEKLSEGAERLAGGLGQLESGAGQLAGGLGTGAEKSELLSSGLGRIGDGLREGRGGDSGPRLSELKQGSPGLFRSAYFTLASLDGSDPARRSQLTSLLNLDRGGSNARMLVVTRDPPTSPDARAVKDRLETEAKALAHETGTEVVVGGIGPAEMDANREFRDQAPLMRVLLSLVSLIVLIPVLRSLTIPILAALLNLLTVSASFGLLALLFNGSLLGGPGYVDAIVVPTAMIVMFGLAIDYEVFVFARMREEFLRTGSTKAAIENGLDHTAHVVTGAATIMIAVFLAFSISEFITIRNFGIAQAIGVFVDAFIVRLVVIPALMGLLGRWCWWTPRWLDRLLPGGSPSTAGPGGTARSAPAP